MDQTELYMLLEMTWQLRRDPKERKAEIDREEGDEILKEFLNQNNETPLEFVDENNTTKTIDFSRFSFNDSPENSQLQQ